MGQLSEYAKRVGFRRRLKRTILIFYVPLMLMAVIPSLMVIVRHYAWGN